MALAPMVPAVFVLVAVVRQLGWLDELQRRVRFEALAFAFAGTALLTFGDGFLEQVGLPRLSGPSGKFVACRPGVRGIEIPR